MFMNSIEYQNLLVRIGLTVEAVPSNSGSLVVRDSGLNYIFEHNGDDPYYFRFVLPGVANVEDLQDRVDEVVNDFNIMFKVSKIIRQGTQYHIVAEQYVFDFSTVELVVRQIMPIMAQEIRQFHQRIIQIRNEYGR